MPIKEFSTADLNTVSRTSSVSNVLEKINGVVVAPSDFTGLLDTYSGTAGDILYVDTVTAGQLTFTQPTATGDFVRVAGYCLADNKIFFSPSQDFIEIG